jgi:hypothetical protein
MRSQLVDARVENPHFATAYTTDVAIRLLPGNFTIPSAISGTKQVAQGFYAFDAASTNRTITLPAAPGGAKSLSIVIRNSSSGAATLTVQDPVGPATVLALTQNETAAFFTIGTSWYGGVIAGAPVGIGTGNVVNSGTPTVGQVALWVDTVTIQGVSSIPAADVTGTAATLTVANQALSGGCTVTSSNQGTKSSGTFTVNPGVCPLQYCVNGGAFTLAAPAADGSMILLVTNNATAGTITFSGFSVGSSTGDALTTTNTNAFSIHIWRVNGVSGYRIAAHQ